MDDIVIKAENLSKVYKLYDKKSDRVKEAIHPGKKRYSKDFYALNNICFDVKRGETLGIIGTNGSGKSTLLKILTGVTAPSGGSYYVNGKVSALLELGAGFNSEYTGLQNIDLQGVMAGYSNEAMVSRREEIIRFADIGDYINQPVKNYSSGMFARLAFAVAISIEPEILIIDETLSVGDVFFQNKCFRKFEELRNLGTSILFVSHDTNTVREMCSRVLWIEHGQQMMFADSRTVCNAYFNAQYQRINEMNAQYVKELENEQLAAENDEIQEIVAPEISENPDSLYSERARILSVYVKDERGEFTSNLVADKQYSVGIITQFFDDIQNVIIGFVLLNNHGMTCIGENTFEQHDTSYEFKRDEIIETTFSFTMPRIRSGEYEICPAVAEGMQEANINLTWLHGASKVTVKRSGYELSEIGLDYEVRNRIVHQVKILSR